MKIHGFQKMTLLDYPGRVACTIFAGGCNLRCPFCHNALLVTKINETPQYDENEILDFLKSRTTLLDGVAITGGEPLCQIDIAGFIKKIKAMGYKVKLDTNGTFPDKLNELIEEKLVDYIAMDVKNSFEKYPETVGVSGFDVSLVKKSIDLIKNSGIEYEFRTTVVKEFHTVSDIESIARYIGSGSSYYLQNFVDSGELICDNLHAVSKEELQNMGKIAAIYVKSAKLRGI